MIGIKELLAFPALLGNLKTLKREDEKGLLYHMDYKGDYYKLLPILEGIFKAGCSTFVHKNVAGEPIMGRNFDLRHFWENPETGKVELTGLIVAIHCNNKNAKYKSVGLADAMYLDPKCKVFHAGSLDDGKTDIKRAIMLPFLCMDGVNEKGVAVSIMHLPTDNRWDEIEYKDINDLTEEEKANLIILENKGEVPDPKNGRTKDNSIAINTADKKAWKVYKNFGCHQTEEGKKTVIHTVLMRMILDSCANVEEAIELAKSVNMISTPTADNHILVCDANGRSVMLEWIHNELVVKDCYHGTNFHSNRDDHYGYGFERDDVMVAAMNKYSNGIPEKMAMYTMAVTSQNCTDDSDYGYTQWSAVYNLVQKSFDVCVHMDYDHVYSYKL